MLSAVSEEIREYLQYGKRIYDRAFWKFLRYSLIILFVPIHYAMVGVWLAIQGLLDSLGIITGSKKPYEETWEKVLIYPFYFFTGLWIVEYTLKGLRVLFSSPEAQQKNELLIFMRDLGIKFNNPSKYLIIKKLYFNELITADDLQKVMSSSETKAFIELINTIPASFKTDPEYIKYYKMFVCFKESPKGVDSLTHFFKLTQRFQPHEIKTLLDKMLDYKLLQQLKQNKKKLISKHRTYPNNVLDIIALRPGNLVDQRRIALYDVIPLNTLSDEKIKILFDKIFAISEHCLDTTGNLLSIFTNLLGTDQADVRLLEGVINALHDYKELLGPDNTYIIASIISSFKTFFYDTSENYRGILLLKALLNSSRGYRIGHFERYSRSMDFENIQQLFTYDQLLSVFSNRTRIAPGCANTGWFFNYAAISIETRRTFLHRIIIPTDGVGLSDAEESQIFEDMEVEVERERARLVNLAMGEADRRRPTALAQRVLDDQSTHKASVVVSATNSVARVNGAMPYLGGVAYSPSDFQASSLRSSSPAILQYRKDINTLVAAIRDLTLDPNTPLKLYRQILVCLRYLPQYTGLSHQQLGTETLIETLKGKDKVWAKPYFQREATRPRYSRDFKISFERSPFNLHSVFALMLHAALQPLDPEIVEKIKTPWLFALPKEMILANYQHVDGQGKSGAPSWSVRLKYLLVAIAKIERAYTPLQYDPAMLVKSIGDGYIIYKIGGIPTKCRLTDNHLYYEIEGKTSLITDTQAEQIDHSHDQNACMGGTFHDLVEALSGMHPCIQVEENPLQKIKDHIEAEFATSIGKQTPVVQCLFLLANHTVIQNPATADDEKIDMTTMASHSRFLSKETAVRQAYNDMQTIVTKHLRTIIYSVDEDQKRAGVRPDISTARDRDKASALQRLFLTYNWKLFVAKTCIETYLNEQTAALQLPTTKWASLNDGIAVEQRIAWLTHLTKILPEIDVVDVEVVNALKAAIQQAQAPEKPQDSGIAVGTMLAAPAARATTGLDGCGENTLLVQSLPQNERP